MRAIYPLKKYKGIRYNVFSVNVVRGCEPDPKMNCESVSMFEGKIFDENMRVWYETLPRGDPHQVVLDCRSTIMQLRKGQIPGIAKKIDEGKEIRERELKEHQEFQKEQRRKLREGKK